MTSIMTLVLLLLGMFDDLSSENLRLVVVLVAAVTAGMIERIAKVAVSRNQNNELLSVRNELFLFCPIVLSVFVVLKWLTLYGGSNSACMSMVRLLHEATESR